MQNKEKKNESMIQFNGKIQNSASSVPTDRSNYLVDGEIYGSKNNKQVYAIQTFSLPNLFKRCGGVGVEILGPSKGRLPTITYLKDKVEHQLNNYSFMRRKNHTALIFLNAKIE